MRYIREPDWTALAAYLLSENSSDQGDEILRWVAESPAHAELLGALRAVITDGPRASADERARTWAAIESGIASAEAVAPRGAEGRLPGRKPRRISGFGWRIIGVAVAASLAIGVGVSTLVTRQRGATGVVAQRESASMQEVVTRSGTKTVVKLPDGSTVVLGVGSRLRYATTFDRSTRDVYLDGEGFFTVIHSAGWPFVVHAGGVTARVLGTRFLVRKYPADTAARVVVAQGRVAVQHEVLKAGDAIVAGPGGTSVVTHGVDVVRELAWMNDSLHFDGAPLSRAIPALEHAFGIRITVSDSTLLAEPITASLENESARGALQIVAEITHSRVVWARDHAVLSRK